MYCLLDHELRCRTVIRIPPYSHCSMYIVFLLSEHCYPWMYCLHDHEHDELRCKVAVHLSVHTVQTKLTAVSCLTNCLNLLIEYACMTQILPANPLLHGLSTMSINTRWDTLVWRNKSCTCRLLNTKATEFPDEWTTVSHCCFNYHNTWLSLPVIEHSCGVNRLPTQ